MEVSVNVIQRPLHFREAGAGYPLNRRLFGLFREQENICHYTDCAIPGSQSVNLM